MHELVRRFVSGIRAEHAHDLADQVVARDGLDGRRRDAFGEALLDPEVRSRPATPPAADA